MLLRMFLSIAQNIINHNRYCTLRNEEGQAVKVIINLEKLCRARIASGLTINEAAREAGVCLATWAAMERGKTIPRPGTLLKICGAIGVKPEEVIKIIE